MATINVYDQKGNKKETMEVSDSIFSVPMNASLVKQVYETMEANSRSGLAHTKDRSERSGSGRKPWKQKGTGRARTGSLRNPIWRKGGIVFGPTKDRNFSGRINVSMKRKALCIALSEKLRDEKLIIVDTLELEEKKTRNASALLKALNVSGNILVGLSLEEMETIRAIINLSKVRVKNSIDVNMLDVFRSATLVISQQSVKEFEKRLVK